jgi:hypothetical protein
MYLSVNQNKACEVKSKMESTKEDSTAKDPLAIAAYIFAVAKI